MSAVPPFNDSVIEQLSRILGDASTGSEITRHFKALNLEDRSGESTKWRRIESVLLAEQRRTGSANVGLALLARILSPVLFADAPVAFEQHRMNANRILSFVGLEYGKDGRFIQKTKAESIDQAQRLASNLRKALTDRHTHPAVLEYCQPELVANDLFHAVFEACKGLFERIREMSGVEADGSPLVDKVFCGNSPILALNTLRTETERNEQTGLAFLLKGCASALRNPRAHEPRLLWSGSDEDALDSFALLSFLHKRLDRCVKTSVNGNRSSLPHE